ncbi:hypothetical protein FHX15_006265 [Rhizobium sp. BK650]|uniref:class I SAM-dependent methyltransferase n=1 Tax=Rhizobium sp. BK650 TaxID=2586990 RepID=UPI00161ED170|nr:class I SAM-dependent methyltransferase [Rhizobium sp. BK650]MBB3660993.1 hypothetical protein [Rhizobium sp. BK650]
MTTSNISKLDRFRSDLRALESGVYFEQTTKLNHPTPDQLYGPSKLFSTIKLAVANFCDEDNCYVEYGTYRGLTLLAAASVSEGVECIGIDNFSQFDESGLNSRIISSQISKTGLTNAKLINADFDVAADTLLPSTLNGRKIGAYFVDGAHDHRSHLVGMARLVPHLSEESAIIVDDTNYAHIRQAIADFLRIFPDFGLLMEAYVPAHPANLSARDQGTAFRGWWNGVNVIVRDQNRLLPRRLPQQPECAMLVTTHDLFRHEFAEIAVDILNDNQRVANGHDVDPQRRIASYREQTPSRHRYFNVQSKDLSTFELV